MKLRIRGNSLRLRLTRQEIERIAQGLDVTETIQFSSTSRLNYVLSSSSHVEKIEAAFSEQTVRVLLPLATAKQWTSSDQVSLLAEQAAGDSRLQLLIEKDFACLKPRQHEHEDAADMFFNPNAERGTCG